MDWSLFPLFQGIHTADDFAENDYRRATAINQSSKYPEFGQQRILFGGGFFQLVPGSFEQYGQTVAFLAAAQIRVGINDQGLMVGRG